MAGSELDTTRSCSGDEEEGSSEGSESESEPDKAPSPPPSSGKALAIPNSSFEGSDSESESADPNIKPLASKPMDDEPLKKPRPKNPTSRYSPPPLKSVAVKRPASEEKIDEREPKRVKEKGVTPVAAPDAENDGEKKQLFQRIWSEDDEVVLIEGMINYIERKGKDPIADVSDFHVFVKNSLNLDVNNRQMLAKVRRLKTKFMNNVGRIEKNGKVRSFSKPHEKKMYELSRKLWGSDSNENEANLNGGLEGSAMEVEHNSVIGFLITDDNIMNQGLELLPGPNKVELKNKWNHLKVQELEHFIKKLELMQEQAKLILNAIKKS